MNKIFKFQPKLIIYLIKKKVHVKKINNFTRRHKYLRLQLFLKIDCLNHFYVFK